MSNAVQGLSYTFQNDAATRELIKVRDRSANNTAGADFVLRGLGGSNARVFDIANNSNAVTISTASNGVLAERMRVDAAGNVGIGTATPTQLLSVNGSMLVNTAGSTGGIFFRRNFEPGGAGTASNCSILVWHPDTGYRDGLQYCGYSGHSFITNSGDERMRITNAGYVGIGTSNPSSILHVQSTADLLFNMTCSDGGATANTFIFNTPAIPRYADMYFWPNGIVNIRAKGDGSYPSRLYIDTAGNVGIGTTVPGHTLQINTTNDNGLRICGKTTGVFSSVRCEFWSDMENPNTAWRPGYISSADNGSWKGRLDFYTNGTGSENLSGSKLAMSIVNGCVGIGTTIPDTDGPLSVRNTNANYVTQRINHVTSTNWALWVQYGSSAGAAASFVLFQGFDGNTRGSISSSGNNTIAYNVGSDERFKEQIEDIVDVRAVLDNLRPRSFYMKGHSPPMKNYGFIAQEVQSDLRYLVTIGDTEDKYQYMDYSKTAPLAVAGVKDLYAVTDVMSQKQHDSEARIVALETELAAMKAFLAAKFPGEYTS